MRPLVFTRDFTVQSSPEAIWRWVADSDRRNRTVRELFPIRNEPLDAEGPQRYVAVTQLGPFQGVYEESPAEFIENEWLRIDRPFRTGPLKRLFIEVKLSPAETEGHVRVVLTLTVEPRYAAAYPGLWVQGTRDARKLERYLCERVAPGAHFSEPHSPVDQGVLARARKELFERIDPADGPLAEKLLGHLEAAPDADLARLRPFALADAWAVDRDELLGLCLQGSVSGLLELSWDTICPSCQTATAQIPKLSELSTAGHCHLCDLRFDLDLDQAVEAVFRPSPSVRRVPEGPFCLASPARFPHVVSQAHLLPGEPLRLKVPTTVGRYRLFVRGGQLASLVVRPAAPSEQAVALADASPLPSLIEVSPGGAIVFTLGGSKALHVKIERLQHVDHAATAHQVMTHPLFRRFFSSDLLRPGLALAIAKVALLFTDLTGSTALYASMGEPAAFRLVLDHFELLREIVERNRGSVVKTLGDAVMAAFTDEDAAARAALEMVERFPEFAAVRPDARGLSLKVGAFAGPCYVVRANDVLDYFGQTVNTAARLQGEAGPGELVLTQALAERLVASGVLSPARVSSSFSKQLKGLASPLELVRIGGVVESARLPAKAS